MSIHKSIKKSGVELESKIDNPKDKYYPKDEISGFFVIENKGIKEIPY